MTEFQLPFASKCGKQKHLDVQKASGQLETTVIYLCIIKYNTVVHEIFIQKINIQFF